LKFGLYRRKKEGKPVDNINYNGFMETGIAVDPERVDDVTRRLA